MATSSVQLTSAKSVCNGEQIWRISDDEIINISTGKPLSVKGFSSWKIEPAKGDKVYIKKAGSNSKKDYLKLRKGQFELGRQFPWKITKGWK